MSEHTDPTHAPVSSPRFMKKRIGLRSCWSSTKTGNNYPVSGDNWCQTRSPYLRLLPLRMRVCMIFSNALVRACCLRSGGAHCPDQGLGPDLVIRQNPNKTACSNIVACCQKRSPCNAHASQGHASQSFPKVRLQGPTGLGFCPKVAEAVTRNVPVICPALPIAPRCSTATKSCRVMGSNDISNLQKSIL